METDLLLNDGEGAPEIYNVATKREQANLGFNACWKMVKQSPSLRKHIRKRAADLYAPSNMGYIKALANETNSMDGLNAHAAVIDELAAIKNRDTYDLIKQAMGAREQPLLFCITTNGFVRNGIFDAQYAYAKKVLYGEVQAPRFLPLIYELDDAAEWDKPEMWVKANPGLGTIKKKEYLEEMVQKAKDDPSFKPTVLVKDFNIPQTAQSAWLTFEDLHNEEQIPEGAKFRYCIGGFDAADSVDLNAAKAICRNPENDKLYIKQMYWIPQAVLDRQEEQGNRRERDSVPYSLWVSQGLMRTCPGKKVDKRVILDWFCELREKEDIYPLYIGYDPWHISDELLRAFEQEFGRNVMIPVRQGVLTLSQPMKDLKADFQEKKIVYNNHPIDKWCLINTEEKKDINGNVQPVKSDERTRRIDGTAALLDAYVVYLDKKDEFESLI